MEQVKPRHLIRQNYLQPLLSHMILTDFNIWVKVNNFVVVEVLLIRKTLKLSSEENFALLNQKFSPAFEVMSKVTNQIIHGINEKYFSIYVSSGTWVLVDKPFQYFDEILLVSNDNNYVSQYESDEIESPYSILQENNNNDHTTIIEYQHDNIHPAVSMSGESNSVVYGNLHSSNPQPSTMIDLTDQQPSIHDYENENESVVDLHGDVGDQPSVEMPCINNIEPALLCHIQEHIETTTATQQQNTNTLSNQLTRARTFDINNVIPEGVVVGCSVEISKAWNRSSFIGGIATVMKIYDDAQTGQQLLDVSYPVDNRIETAVDPYRVIKLVNFETGVGADRAKRRRKL